MSAHQGFGKPPPPPRARNLAGAVLGLLLIVFCAVAVALYAANVGHRRAVLVVVRPIRSGSVIHASDLGEVRISSDPSVHSIPASERNRIAGQVAAVSLVPGTLVTRGEFASGPRLSPGQAVVGLSLKPGQFPPGLRAPDEVMVVDTGVAAESASGGNVSPTGPAVLVAQAEVFSVDPTPDGQTTVVSIVTTVGLAPGVVQAGAKGAVSLVLLGGPGPG